MKFRLMNTTWSRGDIIAEKYAFVKTFGYEIVNSGNKARQYNFKEKTWSNRDVFLEYVDINTDGDIERFISELNKVNDRLYEVIISMVDNEPTLEIYDGYRE